MSLTRQDLHDLFLTGWALTDPPDTAEADRRVRVGLLTAQHLREHLTEAATLHLGHLEGVWASIFDRRLRLLEQGRMLALKAWKQDPPDWPELVRTARRDSGLGEATPDVPPEMMGAAAGALARQRARDNLTVVLAESMTAARAEGHVDALALAADADGYLGFDFDLAFTDAVDALAGLDASYWTDTVASYVNDAVDGSVQDLGRSLAKLVQQQASYDDMIAAVEDLFANSRAVDVAVDLALSAGLSQGALALYASEGVETVAFITAGDERVCTQCEEAEARGPYQLWDFPALPQHALCRCVAMAEDTLPTSPYLTYVTDSLDET